MRGCSDNKVMRRLNDAATMSANRAATRRVSPAALWLVAVALLCFIGRLKADDNLTPASPAVDSLALPVDHSSSADRQASPPPLPAVALPAAAAAVGKARVTSVSFELQFMLIKYEEQRCLNGSSQAAPPATEDEAFCPQAWDTLMCWPPTAAGQLAVQPCPLYINNFFIHANVTRQCMADGRWFRRTDSNKTWSNYSACVPDRTQLPLPTVSVAQLFADHMRYLRLIYQVGYSTSLTSLLFAVVIMISFKKLHCPRNTLHANLFASFILRAVMALLRDGFMSQSVGLSDDHIQYDTTGAIAFRDSDSRQHWECRLIMTLFNYATTANYSWIFIEGLYLHTLLFVAVFSENSSVRLYIVFGWLGPLLCVAPWIIAKATATNELCWNTNPNPGVEWIISGPVIITILVNFAFFVNIIYSLFNKLKAFNSPDSHKYRHRRLAKSVSVLIPLFGVPYIIFLGAQQYYIDVRAELVKLYFELSFNSFNGFLVSLLYCFLNGEVQGEICKKWHRYRLSRRSAANSSTRRGQSHTMTTTYAAVPAGASGSVTSHCNGRSNRGDADHPRGGGGGRRTADGLSVAVSGGAVSTCGSEDDDLDNTVTSWVPRHGSSAGKAGSGRNGSGRSPVSEGVKGRRIELSDDGCSDCDEQQQQQQQQGAGNCIRMARLDNCSKTSRNNNAVTVSPGHSSTSSLKIIQ